MVPTSSSGQKDADPPRISAENTVGTAPSSLIDPKEIFGRGSERVPSILEPGLQCDRDSGTTTSGGNPTASSMPCGVDTTSGGCLPSDRSAAEAILVNGPSTFDPQTSHDTDGPAPGGDRDTQCNFSDACGAEPSSSVPLSAREHLITDPLPFPDLVRPPSPESAHPNAILPPPQAALNPDPTPSCTVPIPRIQDLCLPRPPPEVAALLNAQSANNVISPVFARNSPLVPWEFPSEIGYIWLGLFRVSGVKVIFTSAIRSENRVSCNPPGGNKSAALCRQLEEGGHGATYLALFSGMDFWGRGPA